MCSVAVGACSFEVADVLVPSTSLMPTWMTCREGVAEEDDARADVLVRLVVLLSQRRLGRAVSAEGRAVALGDGPSTALASRSRGRYARLPDWLPTQDFGPSAQHGRREHAGDDAGRRDQR